MGVMEDSGHEFLIGPPLFEYGLTVHVNDPDVTRWLFRFWPIRDVFDPLVHMKPTEPIGSAPPPEPRRVPVPVATAEQWAAMRRLRRRWRPGGGGSDRAGIAFQRAPDFRPPRWPDPDQPQQMHIDVRVEDLDQAEQKVLALGARRLPGGGERFRVYADLVGHPFCLVSW
jgi:hypothetical protein